MTIVEALANVMADVQAVGKTGRNESQGFNFRGIDSVVNAVGPALRKHGVVVLPTIEQVDYATVQVGRNQTTMRECTMRVRFTFYGPDGDSLDAVVCAESMDSGDKGTSKAHSVAFRTCLLQALCIPTDEPDPDSSSYERATAPPPARRSHTEAKQALVDVLKRGQVAEPQNAAKAIWARLTPATYDVTDDEMEALTAAATDTIAAEVEP